MTGDPVDHLRTAASRGDYPSMARLARALYELGLGPREVLRECYGVEFPAEFFVLADTEPTLLVDLTNLPWQLAIPLDRGGPPLEADSLSTTERKIFDHDPDLVPLAFCLSLTVRFGGFVLCYRVTELAAGRPTVFGIDHYVEPGTEVVRCADSLLAALLEHHIANAEHEEQEWRRTRAHSGGTVEEDDVRVAREFVADLEDLRRQVG